MKLSEGTMMCLKERSVAQPLGSNVDPSFLSPFILRSNYIRNYRNILGKKEVIHSSCTVATLETMRTVIPVYYHHLVVICQLHI